MASPIPPGFDFSAVYVDDKKPKIKGIGGVVLYSKVCLPDGIYRIPITQIDPSDDKYEGSKDQKINNLANDTLKALDAYVRERQGDLSCPNARKLEVNWTSGIISYEDGFKLISLSFKEIQDTDLQRNAFIAGKQIASPMTTDPDIGSNRPLVQNKPLQISTQSWHQAHHISKEKYLEQHHASLDASLQAYAPGGLADSATQKIDAADAFIRKLREELETLRDAKRVELANIPIDHGAKKQKTLRELRQLEELIAQLAQSNLDTQAIFRSVPYANDELNGLTEVEQLTRAELSAEEMRGHLYKQHRYQSDRLNKWLGKPEPIFLDAYSQDKGDLLIHKQSDYEARVDNRGGVKKHASMEELVVYNILNLYSDNNDTIINESLNSLGMTIDSEAQSDAIRNALRVAREEARTECPLLAPSEEPVNPNNVVDPAPAPAPVNPAAAPVNPAPAAVVDPVAEAAPVNPAAAPANPDNVAFEAF